MRTILQKPWLQRTAAVLFWLAVWQAAAMVIGQEVFLVSPVQALETLLGLLPQGAFWQRIGYSSGRILLGFGLGAVCSVALAVAAHRWKGIELLLAPVMQVVKAMPVASFIILALVWLSSRQLSFFISFLMVFPPIYLAVLTGLGQADRALLEMAKVYRVPFFRQVRFLYLPAVAPHLRSAVSLGLGLCWKAGIAAEVIGLPDGSVGERLYMAKVHFETPELFAWTAVIVTVSAVLEKLFLRLLDGALRKAGALRAR